MATSTDFNERTSEPPHLAVRARLRELWVFREIFVNLVRKDLKVKYAASVLGTVWSLLNPVVFLAVFSFVSAVLGGGPQDYPVFLLAGLLAWNLFSNSLGNGAQVCVGNANLIKKVYFPREILPLSVIGVGAVDLFLQSIVFFVFLLVTGYGFTWDVLWLYPMSLLGLFLFTSAVTLWVSALNVRYRDIEHLLGLAILVWFWFTPIVYGAGVAHDAFIGRGFLWGISGDALWVVYLANPMAWVISGFQRALYHSADAERILLGVSDGQLALGLGVVIVASAALLYLTWRTFFAMSGDFAEDL